MSDDSFRDRWAEDYDGDQFTGRYECRRCGASVRMHNTDLHDEFHAQIGVQTQQSGVREERPPAGDLDILNYYIGQRVVVTLRDGEVYMGRIAGLTATELEIGPLEPDTPGRIPLQHEDIDRISVRHEPYVPPSLRGES